MKTIQIAPYRDDCRIEGQKIIGAMDGRTFVFELPDGFRMPRSEDATDTTINDILWFERDSIAEALGYRDWEAYEEGWSESDLEDAEDWFHALDEEELSEVYRERDEDEDGYDFVSDAADWWDDLDDEKKVDIYYKNN